ncbi:MAG: hypothetical protein WCR23_09295 [Planctomycetota bacterium]
MSMVTTTTVSSRARRWPRIHCSGWFFLWVRHCRRADALSDFPSVAE